MNFRCENLLVLYFHVKTRYSILIVEKNSLVERLHVLVVCISLLYVCSAYLYFVLLSSNMHTVPMNKQTKIIICKIVCMNSISGREKEGDIGCVLACPTTMYKTSTPVLKSVISNKRKIHIIFSLLL